MTKPLYSVEKEAHCQFVRRADGKLVRLNLRLPMSVRPNHNTAPGHVTPALTSDWLSGVRRRAAPAPRARHRGGRGEDRRAGRGAPRPLRQPPRHQHLPGDLHKYLNDLNDDDNDGDNDVVPKDVSSHPVTSLQHTAPHTHCVLQHYTAPIR